MGREALIHLVFGISIITLPLNFNLQPLLKTVVICLMTDDAVKSFMHRANITFGVEIAFAIGPIGRHGEVDIALADFARK